MGPNSEADGFDDLRRRVAAAVRRQCPPWLSARAEDIAQDVLVKLLRAMKKSDGNRGFSSVYVEKSVSGAVVDEIRRACRRREEPIGDGALMDRVASAGASPERDTEAGEIGRGIVDCLATLLRPRRVAVTLYLHGCTVREAARRLDWSRRKTESLVYRGLADLRRCLAGKGLQP
jgi:RNA polymerase sigma-70 factor (ECF subfamily)